MGKKSKRRAGKRNKQKAEEKQARSIGDEQDEEFVPQQARLASLFGGTLSEIDPDDQFIESSNKEIIQPKELSHLEGASLSSDVIFDKLASLPIGALESLSSYVKETIESNKKIQKELSHLEALHELGSGASLSSLQEESDDQSIESSNKEIPKELSHLEAFYELELGASLSSLEEESDDQSIESNKEIPKELSHLEAFHEFMIWSLSEKADLTPKKFERSTRIAKMIIEGHISSEDIMKKRREVLTKIENKISTLQMLEGISLLMEGIKFENLELELDFRNQLEILVSKHRFMPMHVSVYNSFQEVLSKFSKVGEICFNDCHHFGLTEDDFDQRFRGMLKHIVLSSFRDEATEDQQDLEYYMTLVQKYYTHRSQITEEESQGMIVHDAHRILVDLLKLFEEMHSCWRCKQLQLLGEGKQAKTPICSSCKCAVYCSRECQIKDWKEGKHKENCQHIGLEWSLFEASKRRVRNALRKGRIFTKPTIINGVERECFLHPFEKLDYYLCYMTSPQNARLESMDTFYENVALLACGGTHPIFGEDTISRKLQEKISTADFRFVDLDHGMFTDEKLSALLKIAEVLKYPIDAYDNIAPKQEDLHFYELSVDHFITLYICYDPYDINEQFGRFRLERDFLQGLKTYNKGVQAVNEDNLEVLKESNTDEKEDEDTAFMDGVEQEAAYRCPILTSYMTKPMRNTICGHVYDDKGIRHVYQTKKICPIAGCKKPFNLNDLEEDVEMAMKLKRFHKRKQAGKKRRDTMT